MGNWSSKTDSPPFGSHLKSCCSCCFPWSSRSVPAYDYDEVDDDLEFESLLAANSGYSPSHPFNGRRSGSNLFWERIAGLFSGIKRRSQGSPLLTGHVRGYQTIPTLDPNTQVREEDRLLFGHEADAQVLTEEQIERITTEARVRVLRD